MRGIKKAYEKDFLKRTAFTQNLFKRDCEARAKRGFIDEPLSAPKAQKIYAERFGVTLNSERLFRIRREIFAEHGLDEEGKPRMPATHERSAARDPMDPLFHTAILSTPDLTYGQFLSDSVGKLRGRGLVGKDLRVLVENPRFVVVTDLPDETKSS